MNVSILGINIKKIREEKGLSAYKLSKLAKVGGATISEIESGVRQSLNSSTVEKIANVLGVTTDSLYTTENDVEYIVTDIEETLRVILSSEELTLDNIEMTDNEKEQFMVGAKSLLDIIKLQRNKK